MTIQQVKDLIQNKQKEHKDIYLKIQSDLETLKYKLVEMRDNNAAREAMFIQVQKIAVLKDKAMFHKACLMQLEELIEEIK